MSARTLARLRTICLALPETSERPSHGAPAFFIRNKTTFVTYHDDHHGDGRLDRDLDWDEVETVVEDAYRTVAPKKLVAMLDAPD